MCDVQRAGDLCRFGFTNADGFKGNFIPNCDGGAVGRKRNFKSPSIPPL